MQTKVIYSKWLAAELRKLGFNLLYTDVNNNFPQFNTYVFEDSPQLQTAITSLTRK